VNDLNVKLSKALTFTLESMPRGRDYEHPIRHSCNVPLHHVSVDANSDCFLCECEGWLPIPVGKVSDFETLPQIWNSDLAQMLQNNVKEKQFTWCAVQHCGVTDNNINRPGFSLSINIDDSCNLACPSCRRELRMLDSGPEYEKKRQDLDRILSWLDKFEPAILIHLGGSGDALASLLIRNFIKNYRYRPQQKFSIATNGLLIKKVIDKSAIAPAIDSYSISVDAGTQHVYENVRRPGKWSVLLENLEWLNENKQKSKVILNFVVQKDNFRDLSDFVELCKHYHFFGKITALNDWGTWNNTVSLNPDSWTIANGTYMDHDVADPSHPEHNEFVNTINKIQDCNYPFLNISPIFNKFKNHQSISKQL
jgi:hypothetical protein